MKEVRVHEGGEREEKTKREERKKARIEMGRTEKEKRKKRRERRI